MASDLSSHLELGSSLTVPNVQELAASIPPNENIPERYIRQEVNVGLVDSIDGDEIPVIDLTKLVDEENIDGEELSRLGLACKEWGFFQLINHGITKQVIEKTKNDIMEFFKLPHKEKEAIKQLPGHIEGYGQMFVHSEEQKLDWADMLTLVTLPHKDMRFWPKNPASFRDTLETYTLKIRELVDCLYRLMAKDLGVDPQVMLDVFSGQMQSIRINYYPPCTQANKVLGLSPHSDGIALTVLLQANDVNGLQIKKNGKWFLVKPKPGAFIINIGDMLEILTNGKYKSIEHRAIINMEEERLSIATFHLPRTDAVLCPFPDLVNVDGELYKTISVKEYTREYFSGKLNGKNALERMKLRK
ncbi:S-norcoclaurine synthase 1-like [Phalaenopsis equestris]|uniref:S-norcoclaurine synthase 1-like n=1 Tax=Phalaenopsis equestris TaxID=78828 RepID=UPI0009E5E3F3|nr:S-norcoclaurine synthase 1-like [Phalaenopsis equestris]